MSERRAFVVQKHAKVARGSHGNMHNADLNRRSSWNKRFASFRRDGISFIDPPFVKYESRL